MTKFTQALIIILLAFGLQPAQAPAAAQLWPVVEEKDLDFDKEVDLSGCAIAGLKLSAQAKIYAVGSNKGTDLGWIIDNNSRGASLIKVAVNSPDEPVALILNSYGPTIWHLGWTQGSQIEAVVMTGRLTQKIVGLPANVPILISTEEAGAPCGDFSFSSGSKKVPLKANTVSRHVFGREIDNMFAVIKGQAVVGETLALEASLITKGEVRREDFHRPNTPLYGQFGLDEALKNNLIRKATVDDFDAYKKRNLSNQGLPDHLITPVKGFDFEENSYVVLSPKFIAPDGVYIYYILPEGLAPPPCPLGSCNFLSLDKVDKRDQTAIECSIPNFKRPTDLKIYAIGSDYEVGSLLNFNIGRYTMPRLLKVTVNSPDVPVALMIDGRDIWHFSWTEGTKIAAVVLSNSPWSPILVGLPPDVPILNASDYPFEICKWHSLSSDESLITANNLARHLFQNDIAQFFKLRETESLILGEPPAPETRLETAEIFNPAKFTDPQNPRTVHLAVETALEKGLIRPATTEDVKDYLRALGQGLGLSDSLITCSLGLGSDQAAQGCPRSSLGVENYAPFTDHALLDSYVIQSPDFNLPTGLYPSPDKIWFILPENIPIPDGLAQIAPVFSLAETKRGKNLKQYSLGKRDKFDTLKGYDNNSQAGSERDEPGKKTESGFTLDLAWPPQMKVYAADFSTSWPVDYAVEGQRQRFELVPVAVNSPDEPVAIILNAQGRHWPVLWHFSWTEGTKIAAVVVNGDSAPKIIGLPPEVPIINTLGLPEDLNRQYYFPKTLLTPYNMVSLRGLNNFSRQIFKKDIDYLQLISDTSFFIGLAEPTKKIVTNEKLSIEKLIDPARPWGNQTALTADFLKGQLRATTNEDRRHREEASLRAAGLPDHLINPALASKFVKEQVNNDASIVRCATNLPTPPPQPMKAEYTVLSPDYYIPATLYRNEIVPGLNELSSYNSTWAKFYYPDGSSVMCQYSPFKPESRGQDKKIKPGAASQESWPPHLKLRVNRQDGLEELVGPTDFESDYSSRPKALFNWPDGSVTKCSYYDQAVAPGLSEIELSD